MYFSNLLISKSYYSQFLKEYEINLEKKNEKNYIIKSVVAHSVFPSGHPPKY